MQTSRVDESFQNLTMTSFSPEAFSLRVTLMWLMIAKMTQRR